MKVTPLDIRRKEFKRSVRGYADEEVDLFLDEVADGLERVHQENAELQERIHRLDEQLATHLQLRDALEKTLISAQFQADETKANARKESELILRDAELKARGIVSDSYSEVQKVQQALVQLKHLEEDFRFKFRSLLEGHLKLLAEAPLDMPTGQQVMADAAPPAPEASALAAEPVIAPAGAPLPLETPYVIPPAIEEVPEYPAVALALRPEPVVAPRIAEPVASPLVPDMAPIAEIPVPVPVEPPAAVVAEPLPVMEQEPVSVAQSVTGQPLQWPEEGPTSSTDDATPTGEAAVVATMDVGEDLTRPDMSVDRSIGMNDESVTLIGDDDPLKGFFFSPKQDGADDGLFESDKGGKSKPRDFEW